MSKPKVGMNVAIVNWDQPILDVFMTMRGQKARMPKEEIQEKKLIPMKGKQTKWEREKDVFQDVIKELQFIQEFEDKLLELLKCTDLEPTKL